MSARLAQARDWWAGLSPRERVLVGVLGGLLALAVLVYCMVKPLQAARAEAFADIRTYETLNARLRAASALGQSGPQQRTGSADVVVNAAAQSAGLVVVVQATPQGARATATGVSYDAVMTWLADLARSSSLTATRVEIRGTPMPGQVDATVEFRQ